MKLFFTVVLLVVSGASFAQNTMAAPPQPTMVPFKLIVIDLDTAIVDNGLNAEKDTIEVYHLQHYNATLKEASNMAAQHKNDTGKAKKELQKDLKQEIKQLKARKSAMEHFRYFDVISEYSDEVYTFNFNQFQPAVFRIKSKKTDPATIKKIADTSKADYIVFYDNVHTERAGADSAYILKMTTSLYTKKEGKIILSKETIGDNHNEGGLWTCDVTHQLNCLLINCIRTSVEGVEEIILERQMIYKR